METQKNKDKNGEEKVLPVPQSQLEGSDGDKAYDEQGRFGKDTTETSEDSPDAPEGSDADG